MKLPRFLVACETTVSDKGRLDRNWTFTAAFSIQKVLNSDFHYDLPLTRWWC